GTYAASFTGTTAGTASTLTVTVGGLALAAKPTVTVTGPPAPVIGSHPADPTNSTSATFTFSDARAGVTFLSSLDGSPFAAATSPQTFTGLADGFHTFRVEARDAAGNASDAASFPWTVDTNPPPPPAVVDPLPGCGKTATLYFADAENGVTFL